MKNPHKQEVCLNCDFTFDKPDNYCPNCGQHNTDYHLSAKEMLVELVQSTFNFDSKFAHSIIPFLFKPGFLPRAFMEGKRKHYVHPVRFYLFISVVFFFFFSGAIKNEEIINTDLESSSLISSTRDIDSTFRATTRFVDLAEENGQLDSVQAAAMREGIQNMDSRKLFEEQMLKEGIGVDSIEFVLNGEERSLSENWDIISNVWLRDPAMTPEALMDSLGIDQERRNLLTTKIASQAIKYAQANDPRLWKKEVLDNIPIMMFLLLPLFAVILKLIYIRSKRWYIEHLVFSFHIHAFVFFIMLLMVIGTELDFNDSSLFIGILSLMIYPYLMFKNYYEQGWFKTLIKFWLVGFIYYTILTVAIFLEAAISFMTF